MKKITSLELRYILDELKSLIGLRIGNIYDSGDELRINVDDNIILVSSSRIHLTKKPGKKDLSNFSLFLRRYLKDKIIARVEQHGMTVEIATQGHVLIIELYPKFNCILCDGWYNIIMPLNPDKKNKIMPKMKYIIPQDEELETKEKKPQVVYKNKSVFDAVPFDVDAYKNLDKKYFDSFSEALDYFFSKIKTAERGRHPEKKKKQLKRKRRVKMKRKKRSR